MEKEYIGEHPKTLTNIAETKFAEMAAAVSDVLLDDETSPTDSLVSSTESDEAMLKKAKKKLNEEIQEKDIDEISPELEICSPLSPGTPTHASNSLSLSDGGRDFLIDDEIADQPALLFSDKADLMDSTQFLHSLTDTPTLMETNSNRSSHHHPKPRGYTASPLLELSLRTPISRRRATFLNRAESLDTLSPCESIASDDLMMDFESSSMDSIDRFVGLKKYFFCLQFLLLFFFFSLEFQHQFVVAADLLFMQWMTHNCGQNWKPKVVKLCVNGITF